MRYNPDRARCSLWRYAQTDPLLSPWPLARTFPGVLENLAGPGKAGGPGRESAPGPTGKGPNGLARGRVESSRVVQCVPVPVPVPISVSSVSVSQSMTSSSATDALDMSAKFRSQNPNLEEVSRPDRRPEQLRIQARSTLCLVRMGCEIDYLYQPGRHANASRQCSAPRSTAFSF